VSSSEAEVWWFHNDQPIEGSLPGPAHNIEKSEQEVMDVIITSTLVLHGAYYNEYYGYTEVNLSGKYHCQIVANDISSAIAPSNILNLKPFRGYLLDPPCNSDHEFFSDNITCVGNRSLLFPLAMTTAVSGERTTDTAASTSVAVNTAASSAATSRTATSVFTTLSATALPDNSPTQPVLMYVLIAFALLFGGTTMLVGLYYRRKPGRKYTSMSSYIIIVI
jgi:hypothetical protein